MFWSFLLALIITSILIKQFKVLIRKCKRKEIHYMKIHLNFLPPCGFVMVSGSLFNGKREGPVSEALLLNTNSHFIGFLLNLFLRFQLETWLIFNASPVKVYWCRMNLNKVLLKRSLLISVIPFRLASKYRKGQPAWFADCNRWIQFRGSFEELPLRIVLIDF